MDKEFKAKDGEHITAGELIEILKHYKPQALVLIHAEGCTGHVDEVEESLGGNPILL